MKQLKESDLANESKSTSNVGYIFYHTRFYTFFACSFLQNIYSSGTSETVWASKKQ